MTCEHCGRPFTPKPRYDGRTPRFCSRQCGGAGQRLKAPRTCEDCGGTYTPTGNRQRWCATCQWPSLTCEWCSGTFTTKRSRVEIGKGRFCSKRCANSSSAARGPDHGWFGGGLGFDSKERRWLVTCRDGTQMFYSRAVMAGHLGRLLWPFEIVHHVNGDTEDDRIENLELTTRAEHIRIHMPDLLRARGLVA